MTFVILTEEIGALRRDIGTIVTGFGALTDAVAAQGALLNAVLEAVTADEPGGSALADALIRIVTTLESQTAGIEAMRLGIAQLQARRGPQPAHEVGEC